MPDEKLSIAVQVDVWWIIAAQLLQHHWGHRIRQNRAFRFLKIRVRENEPNCTVSVSQYALWIMFLAQVLA